MTPNRDIKELAKSKGVKLWQIANKLGICDGNFSRKLRYELPLYEKRQILNIIENLSIEK
ncbi:TPA: hypothetical protein CPT98_06455 [Candidatus Gastranaerophilales bacterium HUM_19]|nr:MAG TPA: hypothetical protein CPT98_06455 [Candidatus Gastranaerophilales bacterium HUM_19]DAB25953.1 MAG TPA: hypothetical protein CPT86_05930 [Candidatus Gastranaerophilales bacterium HUM_23]